MMVKIARIDQSNARTLKILRKQQQSSFSFFRFVKFVKFLEILVFFFNKYRYKLCTCVNFEIYTCTYNLNIPVLITTCIAY